MVLQLRRVEESLSGGALVFAEAFRRIECDKCREHGGQGLFVVTLGKDGNGAGESGRWRLGIERSFHDQRNGIRRGFLGRGDLCDGGRNEFGVFGRKTNDFVERFVGLDAVLVELLDDEARFFSRSGIEDFFQLVENAFGLFPGRELVVRSARVGTGAP